MPNARMALGLGLGCLCWATALPALAVQPTADQMLRYSPRQPGIDFTTPTEAEIAQCEVKLIAGARPGSSAWLLLDVTKKPLRKYADSDGDKRIDVWSYFKNGLEVYREIDTNRNNAPDQFRWLNGGGKKWGLDADEDGKIDSWKEISADEVSLEAFQALVTRDFRRLQALFISDAELQAIGLPQAYVDKIRTKLQRAQGRFEEECKKLPETVTKDTVGRVESAPPQCVPGESIGIKHDLLRYPSRTVLFEVSAKHHDWMQTNEMVLIGNAWRMLDVPRLGDITPPTGKGDEKWLAEVAKIDAENMELPLSPPGDNPRLHDLMMRRAALIRQNIGSVQPAERENWLRQLLDNLATAATNSKKGDDTALEQLRQTRDQLVREAKGSNIAGYATFRAMWAEYSAKLVDPGPELPRVQAQWMDKLAGFVAEYPRADDTPDALIQLAMGCEFSGKEDDAKRWYQQMASHFPQHHLTAKAEGAVRRLNLVGKKMDLAGKTVAGDAFDLGTLRGKVVAVYYWASYCETCDQDFDRLRRLQTAFKAKGFELVTVNLDDHDAQAREFLQKTPLPAYHLRDGGMNSPLANHYGIMGLPTLFLIGRDGNVISRTIQMRDLEDEIQKAL